MDMPPPDPQKLLAMWMEWERGTLPPGRVMSNLKTGGLRQLLEELGAPDPAGAPSAQSPAQPAAGRTAPQPAASGGTE